MNIVLITSEGYPFQFSANNSKTEFIAKGLKENGCKVTIVDNLFGTKGESQSLKGVSQSGINYYIFPRKNKLLTLFINLPKLWSILRKEKQNKDNFVVIGMVLYPAYILTTFLCAIQGYKRTTLFHEWHIGYTQRNIIYKIEAWIKDKTFGYFLNGIFPISHFLFDKGKHFHKPQMILPIMSTYNRNRQPYTNSNNFTYCGHANYLLRNNLILDAFKIIHKKYPQAKLTLVLFGNKKQMYDVNQLIQNTHTQSIIIKSQITKEELHKLYDTSLALLIPLDPDSIQDKARFSQKIAEYLDSKRPIITNNVGEIPYYFSNETNAMIVDYTPESFANAMMQLINNTSLANDIGKEGLKTGMKYFDYKNNGVEMIKFLQKL